MKKTLSNNRIYPENLFIKSADFLKNYIRSLNRKKFIEKIFYNKFSNNI